MYKWNSLCLLLTWDCPLDSSFSFTRGIFLHSLVLVEKYNVEVKSCRFITSLPFPSLDLTFHLWTLNQYGMRCSLTVVGRSFVLRFGLILVHGQALTGVVIMLPSEVFKNWCWFYPPKKFLALADILICTSLLPYDEVSNSKPLNNTITLCCIWDCSCMLYADKYCKHASILALGTLSYFQCLVFLVACRHC